MKVLLRDYLGSLKERDELDAILPDILSELGFTVYSRPQRGTVQRGVDVAAIGKDVDGETKVFLFTVKQGDLTRQDWDGSPQAVRSSLNEIQDAYVRNRIPKKYQSLKIVICVVLGGDVQEQVRELFDGYIHSNTTDRVSFEEWNGDALAAFILKGLLREEVLPPEMRKNFRKSVAMIDEPDISYQHFSKLAYQLRTQGVASAKARVRSARQLNLCTWILYVWARDSGNVEAAYSASELALMSAWDLLRPKISKKSGEARSLKHAVDAIVRLHVEISSGFIEGKVIPWSETEDGLTFAVKPGNSVDANLALFKTLGRIGLTGLWFHWMKMAASDEVATELQEKVKTYVSAGLKLIKNNPSLLLPMTDEQGTDVALFLLLWLGSGMGSSGIKSWLSEMARRLDFTLRTRGRYPCASSDYWTLIEHPRDLSDGYFRDSTVGSSLIPIVACWLHALGQKDDVELLAKVAASELEHCTFQLWSPDESTEDVLLRGRHDHGKAITNLPVGRGGEPLLATVADACQMEESFGSLSMIRWNMWPILLVVCRHFRLPVPPEFWIDSLRPRNS